jgi:hypothetical protein
MAVDRAVELVGPRIQLNLEVGRLARPELVRLDLDAVALELERVRRLAAVDGVERVHAGIRDRDDRRRQPEVGLHDLHRSQRGARCRRTLALVVVSVAPAPCEREGRGGEDDADGT